MTEKNNNSIQNVEEFSDKKSLFGIVNLDNDNFKTFQNGIEIDKLDTERTISEKRRNKIDTEISPINDLRVVYRTISVPPKKVNIKSNIITKNPEINAKFVRNLKEIGARKKSLNFNLFYDRLMHFKYNKNKEIEDCKKLKEIEEEKELRKVPLISEKSRNLVKESEDTLYERCLKFKQNAKKKKENLLKEKEDKIKRDEDKILKEINSHKLEKSKINEKINHLMDWDIKNKEKISHLKEESEKRKNEEYTFKPKTNITNDKLSHSPNLVQDCIQSFSDRLTRDLVIRKIKQEKLQSIYTPSFEPNLNHSKMKRFDENVHAKKSLVKSKQIKVKAKTKTKIESMDLSLDQLISQTLGDESIPTRLKDKLIQFRKLESENNNYF